MQSGYIEDLPERRRQIRACVASDVDVFHSLARRTPSQKVDNVKVFEVFEVVCEIDGMGRIANVARQWVEWTCKGLIRSRLN